MPLTAKPFRAALVAAFSACALAACVSVRVDQDKPIEINLNVTVKQEVVIRLERDVQDLVRQNPDLF